MCVIIFFWELFILFENLFGFIWNTIQHNMYSRSQIFQQFPISNMLFHAKLLFKDMSIWRLLYISLHVNCAKAKDFLNWVITYNILTRTRHIDWTDLTDRYSHRRFIRSLAMTESSIHTLIRRSTIPRNYPLAEKRRHESLACSPHFCGLAYLIDTH